MASELLVWQYRRLRRNKDVVCHSASKLPYHPLLSLVVTPFALHFQRTSTSTGEKYLDEKNARRLFRLYSSTLVPAARSQHHIRGLDGTLADPKDHPLIAHLKSIQANYSEAVKREGRGHSAKPSASLGTCVCCVRRPPRLPKRLADIAIKRRVA